MPTEPPASSAPDVEVLADRLRVAVQGCTLHIHGPVQAWRAIEALDDDLLTAAVLAHITRRSTAKMLDLSQSGVAPDDARVRKEVDTIGFCWALLSPKER